MRETFRRRLHNSKKRYASILIFQRRSRTCALPKGLALNLLDANYTNCHQFDKVEAKSWINSCQFVKFVSHSGDETGFGRYFYLLLFSSRTPRYSGRVLSGMMNRI